VETQQAKAPASNSSGIAPVNRRSFTGDGRVMVEMDKMDEMDETKQMKTRCPR